MKAHATLKNLDSESGKHIIIRNLSRILDIRIIDIDVENGMLHFLHTGRKTLEQVKKELNRIGYPMLQCDHESLQKTESRTRNILNSPKSLIKAGGYHLATAR